MRGGPRCLSIFAPTSRHSLPLLAIGGLQCDGTEVKNCATPLANNKCLCEKCDPKYELLNNNKQCAQASWAREWAAGTERTAAHCACPASHPPHNALAEHCGPRQAWVHTRAETPLLGPLCAPLSAVLRDQLHSLHGEHLQVHGMRGRLQGFQRRVHSGAMCVGCSMCCCAGLGVCGWSELGWLWSRRAARKPASARPQGPTRVGPRCL